MKLVIQLPTDLTTGETTDVVIAAIRELWRIEQLRDYERRTRRAQRRAIREVRRRERRERERETP